MHLRSIILPIVGLLLAMILPGPVFAQHPPTMEARSKSDGNSAAGFLDGALHDIYGSHGKARYGKRTGILKSLVNKPSLPNSRESKSSKFFPLVHVWQIVRMHLAERSETNELRQQQQFTREHYPEMYLNRRSRYLKEKLVDEFDTSAHRHGRQQ